jgi:hypothetical protein
MATLAMNRKAGWEIAAPIFRPDVKAIDEESLREGQRRYLEWSKTQPPP